MIYLASQSPRRKELIKKITNNFTAVNPKTEETEKGLNPKNIALQNARKKAIAVKKIYKNDFVIGADTVIELNGQSLGKPKNEKQAFDMLQALSGKTHKVITGVCVIGEKEISKSCITYVTFNDLTKDFILNYIKSGKPFDKAGGYGLQDSENFAKSVKGSRLNVIGFPVKMVKNMLKQAGYKD